MLNIHAVLMSQLRREQEEVISSTFRKRSLQLISMSGFIRSNLYGETTNPTISESVKGLLRRCVKKCHS